MFRRWMLPGFRQRLRRGLIAALLALAVGAVPLASSALAVHSGPENPDEEALWAVEYINAYRKALALPPVTYDARIIMAARAHSRYLAQNLTYGGNPNVEAPQRSGYFGATVQDRLKHMGSAEPYANEVVSARSGGAEQAIERALEGLNNRLPFLQPGQLAVGYGATQRPRDTVHVVDFGGSAGEVRALTWPYPKQTNVPYAWQVPEMPDPLFGHPDWTLVRDRTVGTAISLTFFGKSLKQINLETADLWDDQNNSVRTLRFTPDLAGRLGKDGHSNGVALIPVRPLAPATTYTVWLAGTYKADSTAEAFNHMWSFTTAPREPELVALDARDESGEVHVKAQIRHVRPGMRVFANGLPVRSLKLESGEMFSFVLPAGVPRLDTIGLLTPETTFVEFAIGDRQRPARLADRQLGQAPVKVTIRGRTYDFAARTYANGALLLSAPEVSQLAALGIRTVQISGLNRTHWITSDGRRGITDLGSPTAWVGGTKLALPLAPQVIDGITYVPSSFIESLANVTFSGTPPAAPDENLIQWQQPSARTDQPILEQLSCSGEGSDAGTQRCLYRLTTLAGKPYPDGTKVTVEQYVGKRPLDWVLAQEAVKPADSQWVYTKGGTFEVKRQSRSPDSEAPEVEIFSLGNFGEFHRRVTSLDRGVKAALQAPLALWVGTSGKVEVQAVKFLPQDSGPPALTLVPDGLPVSLLLQEGGTFLDREGKPLGQSISGTYKGGKVVGKAFDQVRIGANKPGAARLSIWDDAGYLLGGSVKMKLRTASTNGEVEFCAAPERQAHCADAIVTLADGHQPPPAGWQEKPGPKTNPVTASCTATFADVPRSHPACRAIEILRDRGAVSGFQDGLFHPEGIVTRAQLAKMLVVAMGQKPLPDERVPFIDVDGHWAATQGYLQAAVAMGALNGFADRTFRPDEPVTRSQLVKIAAAALKLQPAGTPTYTDIESDAWYAGWVAVATKARLIGREAPHPVWIESGFNAAWSGTRAEAALVLANVIESMSGAGK